jgi:hypothetical protein
MQRCPEKQRQRDTVVMRYGTCLGERLLVALSCLIQIAERQQGAGEVVQTDHLRIEGVDEGRRAMPGRVVQVERLL